MSYSFSFDSGTMRSMRHHPTRFHNCMLSATFWWGRLRRPDVGGEPRRRPVLRRPPAGKERRAQLLEGAARATELIDPLEPAECLRVPHRRAVRHARE